MKVKIKKGSSKNFIWYIAKRGCKIVSGIMTKLKSSPAPSSGHKSELGGRLEKGTR
jgi:hypothetical protein